MKSHSDKEPVIKAELSQLISDIETCYNQLHANNSLDLLLPTNLKGRSLGTYASLIQFISTWSRISKGKLRTYTQNEIDAEKKLINLSNEFHGIVALYMCSGNQITNRTGDQTLTDITQDILNKKLAYYKENSTKFRASYDQRDKGVMLACFDHTVCEYPQYFYDNMEEALKYQIRSESSFIALIRSVLNIIARVENSKLRHSYWKGNKVEITEKLGTVIKELIENTEWWSKTAFNSRARYNPNIRGMLLQFDTSEWNKETDEQNTPLGKYLESIKIEVKQHNAKGKGKKALGFFEMSVFDSGPGLARRWTEKDFSDLSLVEEYDAVLSCLQENMSSDSSAISTMRGFGLPRVLKAIGNKGFLRIRSGRLSLYRDFSLTPLQDEIEFKKKMLHLNNWDTQDQNITGMKVAEGTLITIIYPFSY